MAVLEQCALAHRSVLRYVSVFRISSRKGPVLRASASPPCIDWVWLRVLLCPGTESRSEAHCLVALFSEPSLTSVERREERMSKLFREEKKTKTNPKTHCHLLLASSSIYS